MLQGRSQSFCVRVDAQIWAVYRHQGDLKVKTCSPSTWRMPPRQFWALGAQLIASHQHNCSHLHANRQTMSNLPAATDGAVAKRSSGVEEEPRLRYGHLVSESPGAAPAAAPTTRLCVSDKVLAVGRRDGTVQLLDHLGNKASAILLAGLGC